MHFLTVQEEDYELLEIMKELEENDGQTPDNDSVLAPICSQMIQTKPKESHVANTQANNMPMDPEEEDELDFTMMNFNPE